MYGLINAALKDFVIAEYGAERWASIVSHAAISDMTFNKMDPYPDELTYKLVGATATATGASADTVLDRFGEYWVDYTARQGYAPLFEIVGDSLLDFLLSLDALHARVGRSFPKLVPPAFRFDPLDAQTLRMHYLSQRQNLCPMVPGLLRGLSLRFKTPLRVVEDACARRGADHCEFIVTVQPRSTSIRVTQ